MPLNHLMQRLVEINHIGEVANKASITKKVKIMPSLIREWVISLHMMMMMMMYLEKPRPV